MNPNNTPGQPVTPSTPEPEQTPATNNQAPTEPTDSTQAPVSPLEAITKPEEAPSMDVGGSDTQPNTTLDVAAEQTNSVKPVVTAPEKKKMSKNTMYLLIGLGVVLLVAVAVYIFTLQ